ncbi:hypothetical protein [Corynebacterium pilosum]|uniref:hypothetical protein n=1 Tax=Corynebacterium pilosum TaxID=35756 RepID=UPI000A68B3F4|nr:hypothetical protein [Corynebacterium pilosum]
MDKYRIPIWSDWSSGILGGNSAYYGMYQAADSTWIAVACLEPKFSTALREHVGISPTASEAEQKQSLADFFAAHPGSYWDHWALNHDLPIVALR